MTFAQGTGATVNGTPGTKTRAQYSAATVKKVAANTWLAMGDLERVTSVGIMASSVHIATGTCTDVLMEPFNDMAAWTGVGFAAIGAGVTGTAVTFSTNGTADYIIPAPSESDTITVGFNWQINSASTRGIFNLLSDGNTTGQVQIACTSIGAIDVRQIVGGAIIATSASGVLTMGGGATQYIEVQIKMHDTAGTAKIRVNGVEVVNATGLDTRMAGTTKTVFDAVELVNSSGAQLFDDLYISTGAGCSFKGAQAIFAPGVALGLISPLAAVNTGLTITPVMPTGIQNNDVAIMPVMVNAQPASLAASAGWTEFGVTISNTNQSTWWYWKRLTGSEGNPTLTSGTSFNTSLGGYARLYIFRGCRTSGDPFEVVTMNGTPTTSTTPGSAAITTTGPDRLAVCFALVDDDNTWASGNPPSGWRTCGYLASSTTGGDAMFDAICQTVPTATTVAAVNVGTMSAADYWRTMTLALIPA